MNRIYVIGVVLILVSVAGCGMAERESAANLDVLERCTRAIALEADAYERHDRVKRIEEGSPAISVAWQAVVATDRYRASACFSFPPDAFE